MAKIDGKLRDALGGISGILVTPFDNQDRLAPARLRPIIDRAIGAGVHALVANGNTGEFYGLTIAEAETMVHSIAEQMGGRAVLIGGVAELVPSIIVSPPICTRSGKRCASCSRRNDGTLGNAADTARTPPSSPRKPRRATELDFAVSTNVAVDINPAVVTKLADRGSSGSITLAASTGTCPACG